MHTSQVTVGGEHAQVVGSVESSGLDQQKAGQRTRRCPGTAQCEHPGAAERDRHRGPLEPAAAAQQLLGRGQHLGIALNERVRATVKTHRCRQWRLPAPNSHGQEILVVGPSLPEPLVIADQRLESCEVWVEVLGRGPLRGHGSLERAGHLDEVVQVALAHAAGVPPLPQWEERGAERQQQ
jgi:hypothetical protein